MDRVCTIVRVRKGKPNVNLSRHCSRPTPGPLRSTTRAIQTRTSRMVSNSVCSRRGASLTVVSSRSARELPVAAAPSPPLGVNQALPDPAHNFASIRVIAPLGARTRREIPLKWDYAIRAVIPTSRKDPIRGHRCETWCETKCN